MKRTRAHLPQERRSIINPSDPITRINTYLRCYVYNNIKGPLLKASSFDDNGEPKGSPWERDEHAIAVDEESAWAPLRSYINLRGSNAVVVFGCLPRLK